jgi:hypothetical protein
MGIKRILRRKIYTIGAVRREGDRLRNSLASSKEK